MVLFAVESRANAIEGSLLVRIQRMRGTQRTQDLGHRFDSQTHEFPAGQRARRGAGLGDEDFDVPQIMRARMQFEIRQQLALRFWQLRGRRLGGPLHEFDTQARRRRPQRVAFRSHVFRFNESFFFE